MVSGDPIMQGKEGVERGKGAPARPRRRQAQSGFSQRHSLALSFMALSLSWMYANSLIVRCERARGHRK